MSLISQHHLSLQYLYQVLFENEVFYLPEIHTET